MALVMTTYGAASVLKSFLRQVPWECWFGLYQNDWNPATYSTITAVTPANFDGYYGLSRVSLWSEPGISGIFAVSTAPLLVWYRTAGLISNWIFGYYVVDASGALLWAERMGENPTPLIHVGATYQVQPTLSIHSRFTGT